MGKAFLLEELDVILSLLLFQAGGEKGTRRSRVVRVARSESFVSLFPFTVSLTEISVESGWSSTPLPSSFSQSLILPVHTLCDRRFMAEQ